MTGPYKLYLFQESSTGLVRVGLTSNIEARLAYLRGVLPGEVSEVGTYSFANLNDAIRAESMVHDLFSQFRVRNSWYKFGTNSWYKFGTK